MAMTELSSIIDAARPDLVAFIEQLGYSSDQAEAFAKGYIDYAMTLPTLGAKVVVLVEMDDECMTAGFVAAKIDEDEAHKRSLAQKKSDP